VAKLTSGPHVTQLPELHPPLHALPQPPQLAGSLEVSTQLAPHIVSPEEHAHAPATHVPLPQEVPQVPQFEASALVSTHRPPQFVSPDAQAHDPLVHV
jgi:hypothetical protein